MIESSKKRKREKETFEPGDRVSVQNMQSGLWDIKGVITGRRDHQGLESSSYTVKNLHTGRLISRSERNLRLWKPAAAYGENTHSDNNSSSSHPSQKPSQTPIPPIPPTLPISPGSHTEVPDSAERKRKRGPGRPKKSAPRPTQAEESLAALSCQPIRGCLRQPGPTQLGSGGGAATTSTRTVVFGNIQEVWEEGQTTLYRLRNPEFTQKTAKRVWKETQPSPEDADPRQPPRSDLPPPASPRLEAQQQENTSGSG